ncbi:MAG: alginate biosynthesis protein AlgK, partial [Pseudomonas sp.]
ANPSDQSRELAARLDQQLTPAQKPQALRLLQQERQARGAIGQGAGALALQAVQEPEDVEESL